jgi:hypothetical protein
MSASLILRVLLRLVAAAELLAAVGVLMPRAAMVRIHALLGLGAFPAGEVVVYLARTLSGLYVIHGGLLWLVACDLDRYASVLRYVIYTGLAFSVLVTIAGFQAGFPLLWIVAEGPGLFVLSLALLALHHVRRKACTGSDPAT